MKDERWKMKETRRHETMRHCLNYGQNRHSSNRHGEYVDDQKVNRKALWPASNLHTSGHCGLPWMKPLVLTLKPRKSIRVPLWLPGVHPAKFHSARWKLQPLSSIAWKTVWRGLQMWSISRIWTTPWCSVETLQRYRCHDVPGAAWQATCHSICISYNHLIGEKWPLTLQEIRIPSFEVGRKRAVLRLLHKFLLHRGHWRTTFSPEYCPESNSVQPVVGGSQS